MESYGILASRVKLRDPARPPKGIRVKKGKDLSSKSRNKRNEPGWANDTINDNMGYVHSLGLKFPRQALR